MNDTDQGPTPKAAGGRCPICGKPTVEAVRPFCSKRCADIDLGRWLSGSYVIGGESADADEDGHDLAGDEGEDTPRRPGERERRGKD